MTIIVERRTATVEQGRPAPNSKHKVERQAPEDEDASPGGLEGLRR